MTGFFEGDKITMAYSRLHPFQTRPFLRIPLGTFPLLVSFFFPEKARSVAHYWGLEVKRTGQHVAVTPSAAKTPFGIER